MAGTNNTKQTAWIAIGGLFSFGFGIVSSMILSRYFDKADYGTYKQVLYVYHTLVTVFTLGLPKAFSYFLPRVELSQAKSLIRKITNLFFLLGGVFSLLLFFGAPLIADWMNNQDLVIGLRIFAIVPFFLLPTMGLEGIMATFRKTMFSAIYTICTRIFMLVCVTLPVLIFRCGYIESLIGFVASSFLTFLLALYFKNLPVKNEDKDDCNITYKQIFGFSLPILYASLWGTIIHSADQFFISRYYGNVVFAEFANGSTELPFVGMILGACSAVLSPIFSRMSHQQVDPQKEVFPLWISVFKKTAMLTYPLVVYCWFFAEDIMVFLYGGKYDVSYIYFRIKLITYISTLIIYAPLVINIGKVKYYARVHMWTAIIVVGLEFISVHTINSPYAISVISLLCQFGKAIALLSVAAAYFGKRIDHLFPLDLIVKILLPSIAFLYVERLALVWLMPEANALLMIIVSLCIYAGAYYIYSLFMKMDYIALIKPLFKK